MAKPQVHTLVNAGSTPAAAIECRDGVTGNISISKIDVLGSNPSLCVLLRVLIREAYILDNGCKTEVGSIPTTSAKIWRLIKKLFKLARS